MRVADAWKITFESQVERRASRPRRGFPVTERKYERHAGVRNRWYSETVGPRPVLDGDFFSRKQSEHAHDCGSAASGKRSHANAEKWFLIGKGGIRCFTTRSIRT